MGDETVIAHGLSLCLSLDVITIGLWTIEESHARAPDSSTAVITLMISSLHELRTQQLMLSLINNHSKQVIQGQGRGVVATVDVVA